MSAAALPQTVETDTFEASLGYSWFRMMKVVETMRKKMKRTKMQMKRHIHGVTARHRGGPKRIKKVRDPRTLMIRDIN